MEKLQKALKEGDTKAVAAVILTKNKVIAPLTVAFPLLQSLDQALGFGQNGLLEASRADPISSILEPMFPFQSQTILIMSEIARKHSLLVEIRLCDSALGLIISS